MHASNSELRHGGISRKGGMRDGLPSQPQRIKRDLMSPLDARELLYRVDFFSDFDRVVPGLINSVAKVAKSQKAAKGDVIFRQGDPAVDCYAIISGEAGVFISDRAQTSPRQLAGTAQERSRNTDIVMHADPATPQSGDEGIANCWKRLVEGLFAEKAPTTARGQVRANHALSLKAGRHLTAEGFNTFTDKSKIGEKVVRLGPDVVFGELGLLEDQPRAATVKCITDCMFLVVPKEDFMHMFGSQLDKQKISLFADNVPGFAEWAHTNVLKTKTDKKSGRKAVTMQSHPCDHFHKSIAAEGHYFLREGEVAEAKICVILCGEVAFHKLSYAFPRMKPLAATPWLENPARPARILKPVKTTMPLNRVDTVWHRLGPGSMFCSLEIFDLPCAEPFSVVASQDTEIYICSSEDVPKLPEVIQTALKRHAVDTLRPLLWRSPGFQSIANMPNLPKFFTPAADLEEFDDQILR